MARVIDAEFIEKYVNREEHNTPDERWRPESEFVALIDNAPTVDAVEVVHGWWEMDGIYDRCSVCNRVTLMPHLKGLPQFYYCPNCGADMRVGRWKGEGMGDYSCSLCGEVVNGNHREECPNCHAKMDGGDK